MKRPVLALTALLVLVFPGVLPRAEGSDREGHGARVVPRLSTAIPSAHVMVFSTEEGAFDRGVSNQGWWSATYAAWDDNDNYLTGIDLVGNLVRDFFTFDLSRLDRQAVKAFLVVQRYDTAGDPFEVLSLWDVATPAAVLNDNDGTSDLIYADLGSGRTYGSFAIQTGFPENSLVRLELNAAALADINAARGGYFSIGGRLNTAEGAGEYVFGFSDGEGPQYLIVLLS